MFKLQPSPTFWAPVSIPVPGEFDEANIEMEFYHKTRTELDVFLKAAKNTETDTEYLNPVIKSWKGIDVEYSKEALTSLLEGYPGAGQAIVNGYMFSLMHGRRKNL